MSNHGAGNATERLLKRRFFAEHLVSLLREVAYHRKHRDDILPERIDIWHLDEDEGESADPIGF